jgi:hypothetical protein
MGTSLARKIRRIGLEKTTYNTSHEIILVKNEQGMEEEVTTTKSTPVRHRTKLTFEELSLKRSAMIMKWRQHRRQWKNKGITYLTP